MKKVIPKGDLLRMPLMAWFMLLSTNNTKPKKNLLQTDHKPPGYWIFAPLSVGWYGGSGYAQQNIVSRFLAVCFQIDNPLASLSVYGIALQWYRHAHLLRPVDHAHCFSPATNSNAASTRTKYDCLCLFISPFVRLFAFIYGFIGCIWKTYNPRLQSVPTGDLVYSPRMHATVT